MLLVSVEIPFLEKCFDFRIENEEALPVVQLKSEIAEEVCRRTGIVFQGSADDLWLYDEQMNLVLQDQTTVRDSGICDGDALVLF
jgi:hypothetical protein